MNASAKMASLFAVVLLAVCAWGCMTLAEDSEGATATDTATVGQPYSRTFTFTIEEADGVDIFEIQDAEAEGVYCGSAQNTSGGSSYLGLSGTLSVSYTAEKLTATLTVSGTPTGTGTAYINGMVNYWMDCVEGSYFDASAYATAKITITGSSSTTTPVTSISITGLASGTVGESIKLTARTSPTGATDKTVTWSIISGTSNATITNTTDTSTGGTCDLKLNKAGSVTVKATANDGSGVSQTREIGISAASYTSTLKYNANGGSGAPSTDTYEGSSTSNHTFTISSTTPTRTGYTFQGWATSSAATTATYQPGGTISVSYNGTTTLYAVWKVATNTGTTHGSASSPLESLDDDIRTGLGDTYYVKVGSSVTITGIGDGGGADEWWYNVTAVTSGYGLTCSTGYNDESMGCAVGRVTGTITKAGTITVSGEYADGAMSGDISLRIIAVQVQMAESIKMSTTLSTGYTVTMGSTGSYRAVVSPQDASDLTVTWSISDTSIARIVSTTNDTYNGQYRNTVTIEGISPGKITLTATANDGSGVTGTMEITISPYRVSLYYYPNGGLSPYDDEEYWSESQTTTDPSAKLDFTVTDFIPTRTGYDFLGWSKSSTATSATYHAGDTVSIGYGDEFDLYAVWKSNTTNWVLKYDANGGSGAPSQQTASTSESSHTFTISSTKPTRSGYSFLGWSKSSAATSASYQPVGDITVTSATTTLYAVWEKTYSFTLAFDANGGTGAPSSLTYSGTSSTHTFTIPSAQPSKSGYYFLGWSKSASATTASYQPGRTIAADSGTTTLYAVWEKTYSFTLAFNANGGTGAPSSLTYTDTSSTHTFTIPSGQPTRSGYTFEGWARTSGATAKQFSSGDSISVNSGTTTLYAVWKQITYTATLKYNANGGLAAPEDDIYVGTTTQAHEFTVTSQSPVLDGYRLAGWARTSNATTAEHQAGEKITVGYNATVTLYAVWELIEYTATLKFDMNGGTDGPNDLTFTGTSTQAHSFVIPATEPTRDGYTFKGWARTSGAQSAELVPGESVSVGYSATLTLYAVWEQITYTATLMFNANGGTGALAAMVQTHTDTGDVSFTVPSATPTLEGYGFLGWSTDAGASEAQYTAGSTVTVPYSGTTTLYAVWKLTEYTATLEFDANGGEGAPDALTSTSPSKADRAFRIPSTVPTKEGYEFLGWAASAGATEAQYNAGGTVTVPYDGKTTLYAVWKLIVHTTTVKYDANGGTGAPEDYVHTGNGQTLSINLSKIEPTLEGFEFLGWAKAKNATEPEYSPGAPMMIPIGDTVTLYAVWKAIDHASVLYFDANGGEGAPDTMTDTGTGTGNRTFTVPEKEPTRASYEFLGWATSAEGDVRYVAGDSVLVPQDGSVTLYAVWQEVIVFTLAFDANGGTGCPGDITHSGTETSHVFAIPDTVPSKEGYVFLGWAKTADATEKQFSPGDTFSTNGRTTVLYAVWKIESHTATLKYDANGGTGAPDEQTFTREGSGLTQHEFTISETVPTMDGYRFMGWALSEMGGTVYPAGGRISVPFDKTTTLYAIWGEDERVVEVTIGFDPNGGSPSRTMGAVVGMPMTLPAVSYKGYVFDGWYLGDVRVGGIGDSWTPSGEVTLVAHWTAETVEVDRFTVVFDGNGGTAPGSQSDIADGSRITLPEATREGFAFDGWYLGEKFVGNAGDSYTVTSDATLTAHWKEDAAEPGSEDGGEGPWLAVMVLAIVVAVLLAIAYLVTLSGLFSLGAVIMGIVAVAAGLMWGGAL